MGRRWDRERERERDPYKNVSVKRFCRNCRKLEWLNCKENVIQVQATSITKTFKLDHFMNLPFLFFIL